MTRVIPAVFASAISLVAAGRVDPVNRSSGVVVKGYDVMAYFEEGPTIKGSPQFTQEWMGVKWQFASGERRDRFASAPEKYAPQYGG